MTTGDDHRDPAATAAIERLLHGGDCRSALHVTETDSTNTSAMAELGRGDVKPGQLPRLYLADRQTAGRGRRGNRWLSDEGTLTFSLAVPLPSAAEDRWEILSLAAGIGVATAIEFDFAPVRPRLKWPNDIYLDGRKVGGILCETRQGVPGVAIVGIGINVAAAPDLADQPGAVATTCLAAVVGRPLGRYDILESVVSGVLRSLRRIPRSTDALIDAFRDRCWLTDREVAVKIGRDPVRGRCLGITPDGHLLIATESGTVTCRSGEVSLLRPAAGPDAFLSGGLKPPADGPVHRSRR